MKHFQLPGGVKAEEFGYFHEMIVQEEFARTGCPGFCEALASGLSPQTLTRPALLIELTDATHTMHARTHACTMLVPPSNAVEN